MFIRGYFVLGTVLRFRFRILVIFSITFTIRFPFSSSPRRFFCCRLGFLQFSCIQSREECIFDIVRFKVIGPLPSETTRLESAYFKQRTLWVC